MSFEPDPTVATRIKAAAGHLASKVIDLVDDGKQFLDELGAAVTEVQDVCEPADFLTLVLEHLPDNVSGFLPAMGINIADIVNQISAEREKGVTFATEVSRLREIHPDLARGYAHAHAVRHHGVPDFGKVDIDTRRTKSMRKLVDQLLERNVGTVKNDGHTWLLCQIVLRSGYRFTGALRKHESELLQMMVEGKAPTGDLVQLEHYFDYEDIETIAQPVTAAPRSPIVSG